MFICFSKLSLEVNKLLLPFLIFPLAFHSQETIITDRPDQTESIQTVPNKFLQSEVGFLYEKTNESSTETLHPGVLWRYGVNDKFELRLVTEFSTSEVLNEKKTGINPVAVGLKTKLLEEQGIVPNISFLGHLTVGKIASEQFSANGIAPDFRFLFSHSVTEKFCIGYNLGAFWEFENPAANGVYTLSTAYSFTEKLCGFAEVFGTFNAIETPSHSIDGGFSYLISNDFQIDSSAGFGISKNAPDFFISAGLSYRFPLH